MRRITTALATLLTVLALMLTLSACMNEEDYYTSDDVNELIAELEAAIEEKGTDYSTAINALENEYAEKISALESEVEASKAEIAALESEVEANKAEIAALESEVEANKAEIAALEDELAKKIDELTAVFNKKIADANALIDALEAADIENVRRIAILEAQIEALLSKHEHSFGEWIDFSGNANVYCENRLFYRICTKCNVLEWKSGTYENHDFETTTTEPTCVSQGFDESTCKICGKYVKDNYTDTVDHDFKEEYTSDGSFHWIDCKNCDEFKSKGEHDIDESGFCCVCNAPLAASEGILYELSSDKTYAEVIGYTGTATRIIIADEYEGVPVKSIYKQAFYDNDKITSVIIPDSVESIGDYAFSSCDSLTSVTIGNSIESIGDSAFRDCTSLTSVTIPDSVTSIGDEAFRYCDSLTSVTIPDSVTSIGKEAFSGCSSALYTEYEYGKYVGDDNNPYSVLIEITNKNLSAYTINENTKHIGGSVFSYCERLTSIIIPDSVTSIGDEAFRYCDGLTSVTIPDSVTSIGSYAFYYCTSLTSVTIPDSVESIGDHAFYDCTSLTSVTIPDSVTSIGDYAFSSCTSLTSVYINDIEAWCNISFGSDIANPLYYAENLYLNGELVTEIVIPDGVTKIGDYTFYNCSSLTSVTIPDSVTSIGSYAFINCYSLTSVTIPDSVTSIGSYAFINCYSLTSVYINDIEAWCNISFGSNDANPLYNSCNLYLNGELVTELVIPDGVTKIGDYAFYGCKSLTSVTIPDCVTSIGSCAFLYCTSLTSVTIPDSVTGIGESAFYYCYSLTSVTIPDSVTSIGDYAFYGCYNLTSIQYRGTEAEWENIEKGQYWNSNTGNYTIEFNYTDEG